MTTRHLIAHVDLSLGGDVAANQFVYARRQFVAVFAGEDTDINDDTGFTVGNSQGSITNFSCLFTEDRSQQTFFRSQFGFALRSYLTNQDVAGVNFCTDVDDTFFIQVLQCIFAHVGDVSGDFFRSQLGVTGFGFVFFNVDGCQNVIHQQTFIQNDRVFVVVTFPGHETDQQVLTQSDFTHIGGRTIGDNFALFDVLTVVYDGLLIDTSTLVGSLVLQHLVFVNAVSVISADLDLFRIDEFNNAGIFAQDNNTGVAGSLVFHTGTYTRCVGD